MDLNNYKIIEKLIFSVRGRQVMVDFHLAELYNVETKRLNEQVKRNIDRFPESFMFQLDGEEWDVLQSQIATSNLRSHNATAKRRTMPYVFSEQGVAMLSAVLKSDSAIAASIRIMEAFVKMRHLVSSLSLVQNRILHLESKQLQNDKNFERVFEALDNANPLPDKGVFFEGDMIDAYILVSKIIKSAKKSIVLIGNYIDESVLTFLTKRKKGVITTIYTQKINSILQLDIDKHNQQYPSINIRILKNSHDRFMILDDKHLYHLGASLKDLGNKWFAFSQMDSLIKEMLTKTSKQ